MSEGSRVWRNGRRLRGFTLVELMIGIAVAAILLIVAVPGFTATINRNRLATAGNELLASLQLARMEAVRRGNTVVVCPSENADAPNAACSGSDWRQWITFLDEDNNRSRAPAEPMLRASSVHPQVQMTSVDGLASIAFRPDGLAYAATGALLTTIVNACIETTMPDVNGRNVVLRSGSSLVVEDAVPDPACGN